MFDIPDFAGTARAMAVAWSKDKVGRAVGDVTIRDPVVVTATLPRFLLNGDRASMHLDLDNVEGQAGDYRLEVRSEGVDVTGTAAPQTLRLNAKQRNAVTLPLTASGSGRATVIVRVTGPAASCSIAAMLSVRPATGPRSPHGQTHSQRRSLTLSGDLFADLVPGSGSVAVGRHLDRALRRRARRARALSVRVLGQIIAVAAAIYVNDLATAAPRAHTQSTSASASRRPAARSKARTLVRTIRRVATTSGGLDSHFSRRACSRSRTAFSASTGCATSCQRPDPSRGRRRNLAYALYVPARNGAAPVGVCVICRQQLDAIAPPIAKAQIAAALGMLGTALRASASYARTLAARRNRRSTGAATGVGAAMRRRWCPSLRAAPQRHHHRGPAR